VPVILFIIDDAGTIINLNEFASEFTGKSKEENLTGNFLDLIEDEKKILLSIIKKLTGQAFPQSIEVKFKGKNNITFYTILSIKNFFDPKTNQELFIVSVVDITNQKMKAELVKASQLRFENIANSAPVMIWITDVDGLFIFVNNIWCIFTGRNIGEELGLNWIQDVHPDEINDLIDLYKKSVDTRSAFSYEFRFKRIDNVYRWLMMNGVPRSNDDGVFVGFIGTCTDITNQKENEEYIKKINYELENANKNKDKFFSIISHDLRSPLSGIMSILEMIVADYESLEEDELRNILSEAAKSSKNTFILMENLLEWARLQTGKMNFDPQNISLTSVLGSIRDLYAQKLKEKEIKLNFNLEPEYFAFADQQMTESVLRNLISNAIKFTPESGLILVSFTTSESDILIKVKDTGVGMDENQISKLFKLEMTQSSVGTSGERGTGLGLILCKELVEKQNGKIWVESKVNVGSTFFFTLPKLKEF
jgi:PAS domain S-box-containing protein